jgi:hypothetical protein
MQLQAIGHLQTISVTSYLGISFKGLPVNLGDLPVALNFIIGLKNVK